MEEGEEEAGGAVRQTRQMDVEGRSLPHLK